MDSSSPLAAMHPTAPTSWDQRDIYPPHALAAGTLNIRDQLQRTKPDYFNLKSVRGSSPTASLAADLSQNFRIDSEASPRFPTPRRALFTKMDHHRDYSTTPPLPASSSPITLGGDLMDISPLPQKGDVSCTSIEITSPTPTETPDDDADMMDESPVLLRQHSSALLPPALPDARKRSGLRRPSLSRNKGYSTSAIIGRLHPESQGADDDSTSLSLSECFQESPVQDRRPQSANSPSAGGAGAFRAKPQFASLAARTSANLAAHSRRPSNPFQRARRQYRRSLSMFENPGEVVKPATGEPAPQSTLQSVMDIEEVQEPILPHYFPEGQNDSIPRITRSTLVDVLDGKYSEEYDDRVIIDCRFEYEYQGGHIDGAVNYNDKDLLATHLFEVPMDKRMLLVFHCEYSAHRAPLMARFVRAQDRTVNADVYPKLTYPEVYILEGGYSSFFNLYRDRCFPQSYVEMSAPDHAGTCEREMSKLQTRRKGLNRAKTFAFGHRDSMIDESPTSHARGMIEQSPSMMCGNSPILGTERSPARRMASY